MIDVDGSAGDIGVGQLAFRMLTAEHSGEWLDAPLPSAVAVRSGDGVGGSDRVSIIWPSGAIQSCWLEVRLLAGPDTGLTDDDVFYFASLPSDANGDGRVDVADLGILGATYGNSGSMMSADFNGDGKIDVADLGILGANYGRQLAAFVFPPDAQEVFAVGTSVQDEPVVSQQEPVATDLGGLGAGEFQAAVQVDTAPADFPWLLAAATPCVAGQWTVTTVFVADSPAGDESGPAVVALLEV